MMTPKLVSEWYSLKKKGLKGRSVVEDLRFRQLDAKKNADETGYTELQLRARIGEIVLAWMIYDDDVNRQKKRIMDVRQKIAKTLTDKSKPFTRQEVLDYFDYSIREYLKLKKRADEDKKKKEQKTNNLADGNSQNVFNGFKNSNQNQ